MNNSSETTERWKSIFSQTTFNEYAHNIDKLADAFSLTDRSIRCIDEGCRGGLRLAGSGILYQDKATQALLRGHVDGIYSHEECGAAALYARENGLDTDNPDQYGIEWAKKLAGEMGVPYKGHIGIDEMARPSGLHIALVTYYDGSGQFDPFGLSELPPGFLVSRSLLPPEYALQELTVSIDIALGSHGLGEQFTRKTPFIIVPIGNPNDKGLGLDNLSREAESVADKFNGRVTVSGFTAPVA